MTTLNELRNQLERYFSAFETAGLNWLDAAHVVWNERHVTISACRNEAGAPVVRFATFGAVVRFDENGDHPEAGADAAAPGDLRSLYRVIDDSRIEDVDGLAWTQARKFMNEIAHIKRDRRNRADARLLDSWRERALHAAELSRKEWKPGVMDPTEVYQFPDNSILIVGNPRQECGGFSAFEAAVYS